jgi:hypothetical protein
VLLLLFQFATSGFAAFVLEIGEFDVFGKIVVGTCFCEYIRRTVFYDERIQFRPIQVSDLSYKNMVEAVINEFIMFILYQTPLKGQHAPVSLKAEYIDQFIEVEANAPSFSSGGFADFKPRFLVIKIFGIILPVLERIHVVVFRRYPHSFQFCGFHMQGDIKIIKCVYQSYRVIERCPAEVGERKRIPFVYRNAVVPAGVCYGALAGCAHHAYKLQRFGVGHIIYGSLYGNLPPGLLGYSKKA